METLVSKIQSAKPVVQDGALHLFLLYEDSLTNARAETFCRIILNEMPEPVQLVKRSWMVNELRMPRLRLIAAHEAASSQIIILSLRHAEALGKEIENWLATWISTRPGNRSAPHPETLVALFDPVYTGDSSSMHAYLEHVASQANLQFIEHSDDLPGARDLD
jgi:hypothetical protein